MFIRGQDNVLQKFTGCGLVKFGAVIGAIILLCWFFCQFGRSDRVRSDGISVQQVKEQLDRAERNQQSISAGVATVEERTEIIQQLASDITESTERAEQHLSDAENQNARAGELIDECQQILAGAGKRVQARKETH